MTDSSEAEMAFEEWISKQKQYEYCEEDVWIAAWSACAEKAAGMSEEHTCTKPFRDPNGSCADVLDMDCRGVIAAEIRKRLGGKG